MVRLTIYHVQSRAYIEWTCPDFINNYTVYFHGQHPCIPSDTSVTVYLDVNMTASHWTSIYHYERHVAIITMATDKNQFLHNGDVPMPANIQGTLSPCWQISSKYENCKRNSFDSVQWWPRSDQGWGLLIKVFFSSRYFSGFSVLSKKLITCIISRLYLNGDSAT